MKNILFLLLLFPAIVSAQISDDFEDGSISNWTESVPGHWAASTVSPISGTYSLHQIFDNTVAGTDQISIPLGSFNLGGGLTTWRFQLRHGNDPSSTNTWGVFLMSDKNSTGMTPSSLVNAYVLGVNYYPSSASDDLLKLWKVENGVTTVVAASSLNWQTSVTNAHAAGIEVMRTAAGEWEINVDADGGFESLVSVLTTGTTTTINALFFGLYYEYTQTADQMLWFDDLTITPPPDIQAPTIVSVEAVKNNRLRIEFNEDLDPTSSQISANYSVDNSIGNPESAVLNATNPKIVDLFFSQNFTENQSYALLAQNIEDLAGNAMAGEIQNFVWILPYALNVVVINNDTIDVYFSKELEISTAENINNYVLNNSIGNPLSTTLNSTDAKIVRLIFANTFINKTNYTLSLNNIEDIYGNIISNQNINFTYYIPQAFDIVVNEIMFDVSSPAPVALPAQKYIELFNNTDYDINLENWTLTVGTNSAKTFPAKIIPAHGYLIVCDDIAESQFSQYGLTVGILNPTELTSTTGKRIQLKSPSNTLIEDLTYSPEWYQDTEKDNGGWSVERIDPLNFCGATQNWHVTNDYTGGTPGRINSIYAINPDISKPEILNVKLLSARQILISFSEKITELSGLNLANYLLNNSINPSSASINGGSHTEITLTFFQNFSVGTNTLYISNISDNCGNLNNAFTTNFDYQLIHPVAVDVMSQNQLKIKFSEAVEPGTASALVNYTVNNDIGNPSVAALNPNDSTEVNLIFATNFTQGLYNTLVIQDVTDYYSNSMSVATFDFAYYIPKEFDIVINEIMCDINPAPVGLPPFHYVELYNTSNYNINLKDWQFLAEGQSLKTFPEITLQKNTYLILAESSHAEDYAAYGNVVGILGSTDLTISGKNLTLYDAASKIIESVDYSNTWYNDADHNGGGWSLERIDPTNFCGTNDNWAASVDIAGGTPGKINSIFAQNPNIVKPMVDSVSVISSNTVFIYLSKNIQTASLSELSNFSVDNSIGSASEVLIVNENSKAISVRFANQFQDGMEYHLTISNISDNCGNSMLPVDYQFTYLRLHPVSLFVLGTSRLSIKFSETLDKVSAVQIGNYYADNNVDRPESVIRSELDSSVVFLQFPEEFPTGITVTLHIDNVEDVNRNPISPVNLQFTYYIPQAQDIVINELLFNPLTGGADFVELYNRSSQKIDLKDFKIATRDEYNAIDGFSALSEVNYLIPSATYLAFTDSKDLILRDYASPNENGILQIPDLPSFNDDKGTIVLVYMDTIVIDEFHYSDTMHFKLLSTDEGVSLERINYNKVATEISNWHSASSQVGYATPAYQNSQFNLDSVSVSNGSIVISPELFSPDNDGRDDIAAINYKFDESGFVANIKIYDSNGFPVRNLSNNILLSASGSVVWDGLDDNNAKCRSGIYVVYFEAFDLAGNVQRFRKTLVLAVKL